MIVDKGLTQPLVELWTWETPAKLSQIWASLIAQLIKNLPAMKETPFYSWVRKIHWRRDRLPTPVSSGFPGGPAGKEATCNVGDLDSIPGWEDPLEKEKATHSNILAWRIPTWLSDFQRTMLCTPDQFIMGIPDQPVTRTGKGAYSWVTKNPSAEFHSQRWISGMSHQQSTVPASGKMSFWRDRSGWSIPVVIKDIEEPRMLHCHTFHNVSLSVSTQMGRMTTSRKLSALT